MTHDLLTRVWWRNPRHTMPVVALISLAGAALLWYLPRIYPGLDVSLWTTVALGFFTASIGASIALWIYSFMSAESQSREWNHDMELRHFEQIYGPLYQELGEVVDGLRDYHYAGLSKWMEIRRGYLEPFVERGLVKGLDDMDAGLARLGRLSDVAWASAKIVLAGKAPPFLEARHLPVAAAPELVNVLSADFYFAVNPNKDVPQANNLAGLQDVFKRHRVEDPWGAASTFVIQMKADMCADKTIRDYDKLCEALLPKAEEIRQRVKVRLQDPFKQQG